MTANGKLREWIERDLSRFGRKLVEDQPAENGQIRLTIYTERNCYTFTSRSDYLGCEVWSREDHPQRRDLIDGSLSEETWHSILADIVCFEMVGPEMAKPLTGAGLLHRPPGPFKLAATAADWDQNQKKPD